MAQLNLVKLINFFDEAPYESRGHATSLCSLLGEELAINLLKDYVERRGEKFELINRICTQKTRKGFRLDAWIAIKHKEGLFHYQTEIKNWSAHSIGGKQLDADADEESLIKFRKARWQEQFTDINEIKNAQKVLIKMRGDEKYDAITKRPLLCFWFPMHPEGKGDCFFHVPVRNNENFENLWVFSMSNYVRYLVAQGYNKIDFEMEKTDSRIDWVNQIYSEST